MDKKSLNSRVATRIGCDAKTVGKLSESLADVFGEIIAEGDIIAIPGFGDFIPEMHAEHVGLSDDGRRMLFPPEITLKFLPGTALRNRMP